MTRLRLPNAATLAAVALLTLRAAACAAEPADEDDPNKPTGQLRNPGSRKAGADIAPASSEPAAALKRLTLPPGLVARLWAAEPMLANPVAFTIDEQGRIYVAETYRYGSSTLDIRSYMWTLEDELANRTTADWLATIKRSFGDAGLKELSIESERIRLLEDTKRTGVAGKSTLFAEGFNSPQDGVASGVLARRGQVWFTNIPHVWRLDTAAPGGPAVKRTAISSGYGVRFNFTGHDLHGLTWGPDGKLYFSNGDRGAHATGPDGSVADTPDCGAVYRCNPDGTQLEVFATGLRNPQSLAFNEYGDLFTGDNDCDQGDEERLVHVVEGGDSGWRVGYQFPPLVKDSPWLREKLWHPRHAQQAAYLLAPICNIEDGPSGIAYHPGTGLNDSYRGALFITHFKGSVANSGIYTYNLKPSGASYAIADVKPFLKSALPTDVKFGPDGRLYYSDWADGWPKSKRGRIYVISDPAHEKNALIQETEKLIGSDWTKRSSDELAKHLAHPDWRVRLEAQFTLAERGAVSIPILANVAAKVGPVSDRPHPDRLARLHAIWGLGQLAESKFHEALNPLRSLIGDPDSEVRGQVLKILGARMEDHLRTQFIGALKDDSNRVRFFAAQSLGKITRVIDHMNVTDQITLALVDALRANDDKDSYLRHALTLALSNSLESGMPPTRETLATKVSNDSRSVRLGVLLALRRLGRPEVAKFLKDSDPFIVREAALAINDAPIAAAYPQLAALVSVGDAAPSPRYSADESTILRALNAHFRLGQPANAAALAAYAANSAAPAKLRAEALAQLALWPKPPQRDRLVGTYRPLPEKTRDAAVVKKVIEPILPGLLDPQTPDAVQSATLDLLIKLEIGGAQDTLFAVVANAASPAATRAAALTTLDKLKHPRLAEALKIAGDSDTSALRLVALGLSARISPEATAPVLASLVTRGNAEEQRTALRSLGFSRHATAGPLLADQLKKLAAGEVPPAVQLDLLNAASRRSEPDVKQLLADRDAALAKDADPLAPYRVALEGGDARRGARVYQNQPALACVRCHRVGTETGGEAGPNLAGVGAKNTREALLESIVKPNAKISPGFDTVVVTRKSGGVVAGIVAGETADALTMRDTDNKLHEVNKTDIAKREGAPSGMPEIYGTILTKSELRDVIEYLASLKEARADATDTRPRALRAM